MARPRATPGAPPTTERLLGAAEAEFARVGLTRARLEDIAGAAGIGRPSLLYHFQTKEALYAAVVERAFARLGAALLPGFAAPGLGFAARFDMLLAAFLAFLEQEPAFSPLVIREVLDGEGPGRELILAGTVPILRQLERVVEREGQGAVRPGAPVRQILLQIASAALLRAAAGPLKEPLWGKKDTLPAQARLLLLADPIPQESP